MQLAHISCHRVVPSSLQIGIAGAIPCVLAMGREWDANRTFSLQAHTKKHGRFSASATLPQLSRKRPRTDQRRLAPGASLALFMAVSARASGNRHKRHVPHSPSHRGHNYHQCFVDTAPELH
eukprot:COSAG02_NODE_1296_length_13393_cov_15.825109_9_plen_122_part_00